MARIRSWYTPRLSGTDVEGGSAYGGGGGGGGDIGDYFTALLRRKMAQADEDRRRRMAAEDEERRYLREARAPRERSFTGPGPAVRWEPWALPQAQVARERRTPGYTPQAIRDYESAMATRRSLGMLPERSTVEASGLSTTEPLSPFEGPFVESERKRRERELVESLGRRA